MAILMGIAWLLVMLFAFWGLTQGDYTLVLAGRVVDQNTGQPIAGARVTSPEHYLQFYYSDSLGNFRCSGHGSGPWFDRPELLVEANGYESKYLDLRKSHRHGASDLLISLSPSQGAQSVFYSRERIKNEVYGKLLALVIVLVTVVFLFVKKIPWRYLWLPALILFNFSFQINQLNGDFEIWVLNDLIFSERFFDSALCMNIFFPLPAILFWVYYFVKIRKMPPALQKN